MKRVEDLEIEEDLAFERRASRWQRAGQGLLVVLLLAAVAGFFGSGPAARAVAADETSGLKVEYPRFARRLAPCELVLEASPRIGRDGELQVWFDRSFADRFQWESSWPEPEGMEIQDERLIMRFRLQPGQGPVRLLCYLKPGHAGWGRIAAGIVDGPTVSFNVIVYP